MAKLIKWGPSLLALILGGLQIFGGPVHDFVAAHQVIYGFLVGLQGIVNHVLESPLKS